MEFIQNGGWIWIKNGGVLMYFIGIMSVLGLAVVVERITYFITKEKGSFDEVKPAIKVYIEKNDVNGAVSFLDKYENSTFIVLKELLFQWDAKSDVDPVLLEEKAREVGLSQIPRLEKGMWLLGMVAHTTPLMGLLGTVTGMIQAFNAISLHGTGDPAVLAAGIAKALITTAGGLIVAIPALIFYNFFNKRIDVIVNDMEKASVELVNFFRK